MTAGGPRPPYPPPPPPRPPKPASRLVAGVLWLIAAGTAGGATFADLYHASLGRNTTVIVGFWHQVAIQNGREIPNGTVDYGVAVIVAAVVLLLAVLLVFTSARRWLSAVPGIFGTGMLFALSLNWILIVLSAPAGSGVSLQLGMWLLFGATLIALVGLVVALAERVRPFQPRPYMPGPPPPPPPPRRWEPETPRYGVPVQQPPPPQPAPEPPTPSEAPAAEQPKPEPPTSGPPTSEPPTSEPSHLEQPEPTTSITRPPAQTEPAEPQPPGSIARKLDGDDK
jgi:outer membrane biosynthesis protein TonB